MIVRYKRARLKARQLLAEAGIAEAPVSMDAVLAVLDRVRIRYRPFAGELDGMVYRHTDGSMVIGVNCAHSPTRQRFTIAHEIGHVVLHTEEELHVDDGQVLGLRNAESSKAVEPKEIEANTFAAELLMPEAFLRPRVEELPQALPGDEAVELLAREFQVSTVAMTYRLTHLHLIR